MHRRAREPAVPELDGRCLQLDDISSFSSAFPLSHVAGLVKLKERNPPHRGMLAGGEAATFPAKG